MQRIGSGLYATKIKVTSGTDNELVPQGIQFYEIDFMPQVDCTVTINGTYELEAMGGVGIVTDRSDVMVHSFKVHEDGINYAFGGKY